MSAPEYDIETILPVEDRVPAARQEEPARRWPTAPRPEVVAQGPLGAILALLEPQTDADMTGILMHILVSVGNAIGRKRYIQIGPARHYLNENILVIGDSMIGKKGTALRESQRIMQHAAPAWAENNIKSGLSSGEGLIWLVRDPIEKQEVVKDRDGNVNGYQTVIADPGVSDKRLLITMSEFSQVQKVMKRESNTLGEVIRHAWDGEKLAIATKTSPATATGAHISIIGHSTPEEFRKLLNTTDEANGFLNRFMIVMVRESRVLPFGGNVDERSLRALSVELQDAIEFGQEAEAPLVMAPDFKDAWKAAYGWLTKKRSPRLSPLLARAAPHVMRLAGIYAVLDCSPELHAEHLEAALELWQYVEASTAYLFHGNTGSALAERLAAILDAYPDGITMTGLHSATNRALNAVEMRAALGELRDAGRARCEEVDTGARKRETWFPVNRPNSSINSYSSLALGSADASGNGKYSNNSYSSEASAA